MVGSVTERTTRLEWYAAATHDAEEKIVAKKRKSIVEVPQVGHSYIDTMTPLQKTLQSHVASVDPKEQKSESKSVWGTISDWFRNLFGISNSESEEDEEVKTITDAMTDLTVQSSEVNKLPSNPQLKAPSKAHQALVDMMHELNRQITKSKEDTAELEKELSKVTSQSLEHLFNKMLIEYGLIQKAIKDQLRLDTEQDTMSMHGKNKKLHTYHFDLMGDIQEANERQGTIKKLNLAATVLVIGVLALTFFSGGLAGILGGIIPAAGISKGGLTLLEGKLKWDRDQKTSELAGVGHESKTNSNKIHDNLMGTQDLDKEVAHLWKLMRHHIENMVRTSQLFRR